MKKIIICAAILTAAACAAGVGATTNWVARYVDSRVAEIEKKIATSKTATGAAFTYALPDGGGVVSNSFESASVGGLILTDCAAGNALSLTNGIIFAWNGTNYQHGAKTITATQTNLTIGAYSTMILDGGCWLADPSTNRLARLWSTLLQPSVANKAIRGN